MCMVNCPRTGTFLLLRKQLKKLERLNVFKSVGPDGIHPRILKEQCEHLCKPLYKLFNKSLSEGQLPDDWKQAKVSAIFKRKGSRKKAGNYRPVSLTCILCKLLNGCIGDHCSRVATLICSIVNLVAVRSVLFFDMEVIIWVYRCFLAWLPERQLWGTLGICIHPRWPLWTPGSPPDKISFN